MVRGKGGYDTTTHRSGTLTLFTSMEHIGPANKDETGDLPTL